VSDNAYKILQPGEGLERLSVPGETLSYKVCGDDNGGAFDYLVLTILPGSGPPLHVHHVQHETIHFVTGRYKVQAADDVRIVDGGGFLWVSPSVPHCFVNLSSEPGMCVLTYTPGNSHKFFEEFGPAVRSFNGPPDPAVIGPIFERHTWSVVGPQLAADEDLTPLPVGAGHPEHAGDAAAA
jgi:quercetin dioxygenase-like cupin family protein